MHLFVSAFLLYVGSVVILVFILIFYFAPQYGHTNVLVFTGICSLMGSLSVKFEFSVAQALFIFQNYASLFKNAFVMFN